MILADVIHPSPGDSGIGTRAAVGGVRQAPIDAIGPTTTHLESDEELLY